MILLLFTAIFSQPAGIQVTGYHIPEGDSSSLLYASLPLVGKKHWREMRASPRCDLPKEKPTMLLMKTKKLVEKSRS